MPRTSCPTLIKGSKINPEQEAYLEGFFNGLEQRGILFEDIAPNPVSLSGSSSTLEDLVFEERVKKSSHPLDTYPRIVENSETGVEPDKEDQFRFKWHGLFYETPLKNTYMARLRIPGGELKSYQLRELAAISSALTTGYIQITTRANLQFRSIEGRNTPEVLRRIQSIGLHTRGAGADNVRNLTCDPTTGIDPTEIVDVMPYIQELSQVLINSREFSDLPRKFNIAISGGGSISCVEDTNDIGVTAIQVLPISSRGEAGKDSSWRLYTDHLTPGVYFRLLLGGATGHSSFAADAGVLVSPNLLLKAILAVLRVYLTKGDRSNRKKARLKHLLETIPLPDFLKSVEEVIGFKLIRQPKDEIFPPTSASSSNQASGNAHPHLGVHPQKQAGLYYIGATPSMGEMTAKQLTRLAEISKLYGNGTVRLTVWQSVILPNIPEHFISTARLALKRVGLHCDPPALNASFVACTGNAHCKFANSNTKKHARELMIYLTEKLELDQTINIHFTGCSNSCAQHYMGDIGLLGVKVKQDGQTVEGYHIFVGGGFGVRQALGRLLYSSVSTDRLNVILEGLLRTYLSHRRPRESFQEFTIRHDTGSLLRLIGG